jgi:hypothetical protein
MVEPGIEPGTSLSVVRLRYKNMQISEDTKGKGKAFPLQA